MAKTSYHLIKRAKAQNTTVSEMIKAALEQTETLEAAADVLGITHPTLIYHMQDKGITVQTKRCRKVMVEGEPTI